MSAYSARKDLPPAPAMRASETPTVTSIYSDHNDEAPPPPPHASKPSDGKTDGNHPSYHAHPRQQVNDYGPQVRQSKLPIFTQVRSMLRKPAPLLTPGNAKWDDYTGELSDSGKAPHVKPSTYETAFKASRKRSPERPNKSRRNISPVSVLRDEEVMSAPPLQASRYSPQDMSPVSPVSPVSPMQDYGNDEEFEFMPEMVPEPLSPNVQRAPPPPQTPPSSQQIKRKPVSRCVSTVENEPPASPPQRSPSETSDTGGRFSEYQDPKDQHQPNSHFSWTTYAPSVAAGRPSIDTMAGRPSMSSYRPAGREPKTSHFSWSTVNTAATNRGHVESPPSSPPPPVPAKYSGPPVQSILSRQRPIKRIEKEEWTAPPRKSSRQEDATPSESLTPVSAGTARVLPMPWDRKSQTSRTHSPASATTDRYGGGKALPLPPRSAELSHLESLLAQERSLALQKRNVQKAVSELEKIEKASPMEVPFATVRDAKKRLEYHRKRLAEVQLEERDVGIAITRARRKQEEDNGWEGGTLWVRRVTS